MSVTNCAKSLQSCWTLCDPMDCSLLGSSVHRILQTRILEWVVMPSSRGSSQPKDQTCTLSSSALAGGFLTTSAAWEALLTKYILLNNFEVPQTQLCEERAGHLGFFGIRVQCCKLMGERVAESKMGAEGGFSEELQGRREEVNVRPTHFSRLSAGEKQNVDSRITRDCLAFWPSSDLAQCLRQHYDVLSTRLTVPA